MAREHLPEEFVLAGWRPDFWTPEDLLNRTDAFVASDNAADEVLRARLVAAAGTRGADRLLPPGPAGSTVIPPGLDVATISYMVGEVLGRVGTAPFFTGLAAPLAPPSGLPRPPSSGSNAWGLAPARPATGSPLLANDPHRRSSIRRFAIWFISPLRAGT